MRVIPILNENELKNISYILEFEGNAIIIDPYNIKKIINILETKKLKPMAIINTHEHYDHIEGNNKLKELTKCQIWTTQTVKIENADTILEENRKINFSGDSAIELISTPGHTMRHICIKLYHCNKLFGIITGDTIFNAGVGNCYSGDPEILYETIKTYFINLENHINIYPGHDYLINNCKFALSIEENNEEILKIMNEYYKMYEMGNILITDIEIEKKINPFFRLNELKEILNTQTEKETFLKLRELRNNW